MVEQVKEEQEYMKAETKEILINQEGDGVTLTDTGIRKYLDLFPNKVLYDVDYRKETANKTDASKGITKHPLLSSEDYGDNLDSTGLLKLTTEDELRYFSIDGDVSKTMRTDRKLINLYKESKGNFNIGTHLIKFKLPEGFEYEIRYSIRVNQEEVGVYQTLH